jgi:hypothetical protein
MSHLVSPLKKIDIKPPTPAPLYMIIAGREQSTMTGSVPER